jgi:cytochrome c553
MCWGLKMRTRLAMAFGWVLAAMAGPALAAGEAAERQAQRECAICHGPQGNADSPLFPSLAGQSSEYMVSQLTCFREKTRGDRFAKDFMWGVAGWLSPEEIKALSDYYAAQTPAPGVPGDPALMAKGQAIYDKGDVERGNLPCAPCHGANGEGMSANPRLAGQNVEYAIKQLRATLNMSERPAAAPMHAAIKSLTPDEELALATYLRSK